MRHLPADEAKLREAKDCIDLLLDAGAYINIQNKNGETPLHHAIFRRNRDIAIHLLNRKANPYITNKYTALASCVLFTK